MLIYNGETYQDEITASQGNLVLYRALVGETLAIDNLRVPIVTGTKPIRLLGSDQDEIYDYFVSADGYEFCLSTEDRTPEFVSNAEGQLYHQNNLVGQYYINKIKQTAEDEHEMRFYSAVSLLNHSKHFGGLYEGEIAGTVISDIMGDVPHTIDDDIANIEIYGYLPYSTRRGNLQLVLMAVGAALVNSADGSLRVTSLTDTIAGTFGADRVFPGGSLEDVTPATAVQVTEHNFIPSTETETLYQNTTFETETIFFNAPHHDFTITNGTIVNSGVNFVTFEGSGHVTITGQKYIHIKRVITVGTPPTGAVTDVVRTITSNTMLSPYNAADVAGRVYDFLQATQIIKQEVIFGRERPGDVVRVQHPYTKELVEATIKSMDVALGFTQFRAMTDFLIGYTPQSPIAGFTNYTILTGSGTFTAPSDKIRVILVSGGQGGQGGRSGASGSSSSPGKGGQGGGPGEGGLILEINLNVTTGQAITYTCGEGGEGGESDEEGAEGSPTIFGSYTSATGRRFSAEGYIEKKTGEVLSLIGAESGISGGDGSGSRGDGNPVEFDGVTYYPGPQGQTTNAHGITAYGGAGGGAAAGSDGHEGGSGEVHWHATDGYYIPTDGDGGKGATAAIEGIDGVAFGQGGSGGHGGGGGGQSQPYIFGDGGVGGKGSKGGNGADGCIIVYW